MFAAKVFLPGSPVQEVIVAKRGDTLRPKPIIGWDKEGMPFDFTGCVFLMQVRRVPDGEVLLTVPDDSFTITQDETGTAEGVNNKVIIEHTSDDMWFETGRWYYDIQMTDTQNRIFTIISEIFILTKDVTWAV